MVLAVLGQVTSGGDVAGFGAASLASGGAVGLVLWRILEQREKRHAVEMDAANRRIDALTNRLFLLADKSTAVADTARRVVEKDTDATTEALGLQLERVAALLEERGHR